MNIDSIQNGIVLDHITAGKGMLVYKYLGLDNLKCSVAIIKNATSHKMGRKDILKIDHPDYDINLDILGYVDLGISVSIIKDGVTTEKKKVGLPEQIVNVVKCKNPRCITTTEQGIKQIFKLTDKEKEPIVAYIVRRKIRAKRLAGKKKLYKLLDCAIIRTITSI